MSGVVQCSCGKGKAFTLVELLVSLTVLVILVGVLASLLRTSQSMLTSTTSQIQKFQDVRDAFDSVTRRLSQATLNTYLDYFNSSNQAITPTNAASFVPSQYGRQSELRFFSGSAPASITATAPAGYTVVPGDAVFFQAPLGNVTDRADYAGRDTLLNTCGYFVEFNSDSLSRPGFLSSMAAPPALRYRYRLMELVEPSDAFSLYNLEEAAGGNGSYTTTTWFNNLIYPAGFPGTPRPVNVVAENIVALIIIPKLSPGDQKAGGYTDGSLSPAYLYDSTGTSPQQTTSDPNLNPKNQLPPILQVTMVAVDEVSFNRLQGTATTPPNGLTTQMSNLFQKVGDTVNPSNAGYAQDLQTLQNLLQAQRLDYRVFTSNVSIKGAKWSRDQTN